MSNIIKEVNKNWGSMYCPLCGSLLTIYTILNNDDDSVYENHLECTCSKGCFVDNVPLYLHHPLRGIDSSPGDSWSLSWVK